MKATLRIRPWLPGLLLCAAVGAQAAGLDADGDGVVAPDTDGQLILRHLFGFSGATLTEGVLGGGATRDAAAITAYLHATGDLLDVDGDTRRDALSDGILILRRLLGDGGDRLTAAALSPGATRDAAAIAAWIDGALGLDIINDTGITACANATQNGLPCPVADFPGQDAEHGRDLTHPDPADGHAGFSFTKLDADGAPLPAAAPDWVCVRDNLTGLVWEVKSDDGGLRDKDWTYTWYNPDPATNGGSAGTPDGGDNCFDAVRCDTHK